MFQSPNSGSNREDDNEKGVYVVNIFNSLAQGKSFKSICSEFSLTQEQVLIILKYVANVMQDKKSFFNRLNGMVEELNIKNGKINKDEFKSPVEEHCLRGFSQTGMDNLIVYIDGASRGNPGDAGIGVVFYDEQKNLIREVKEYIGIATNNVAEYTALIKALKIASEQFRAGKIKIFSDSELVVKQVLGYYKVRDKFLKELFVQVKELLIKFEKVEIKHIERLENKHADKLANISINLK